MSDVRGVLVLSPNWLGDAVMALPAIEDVRGGVPDARLVVAARAPVARLFTLVPSVDEIVELEWGGRLSQAAARRRDVARLRAAGAGVAILLPNSFAAAWLARSAGIAERWGYASDMRGPLLSRAVDKPSASMHQGRYYQHLVRALGMPNGPLEPRVTVPAVPVSEARTLLGTHGWNGVRPLVVCAPGAAYGTAKRWLPAHFASLVTALVAADGVHCALVGSRVDGQTASVVRDLVPPAERVHVSDLCGLTTLEVLAGVLSLARACVSNDSGAMHLAAAAGVPLAAIFGPTNERETAPLARAGVPTQLLINPVSCRPCMLRECPIDHPCMRDLEPSRVLTTMRAMLTRAPDPRSATPDVRSPMSDPRS